MYKIKWEEIVGRKCLSSIILFSFHWQESGLYSLKKFYFFLNRH
jgi:hypothetical protein